MVEESQGHGGFDGKIRVPPLPTPPAAPAGRPGSDRFRGQPHHHIAAANEGLVVGRPIRNAVLRLIRGMNLRLHPCSVAPAETRRAGQTAPPAEGLSCNNAYTRYQRLITRLASADRIVTDDCPPDLSTLLRLTLDSRCDLRLRESPRPRPIQRLRKRIAGSGYRVATLMAAALGRLRRPEAIVYAIDVLGRGRACDPRIERLYCLLEDEGVSFTEITWSVDPRRALRNWWQRRRPCLYIQGFEVPVSPARRPANSQSTGDASMRLEDRLLMGLATQVMLPAANTSVRLIEKLKRVVQFLGVRRAFAANTSVRLIEKLKRVVQFLGVRRAFFIDDYRHAYELVVACKRCGIPTLGVQHGQFNAYSVGLMAYGFDSPQRHSFDRYWLWSHFFRDQLLRQSDLYREMDVFVGGPTQVFDEPAAPADLSTRRTANTRVRVLWLAEQYESSLQRSEVTPYVARLIADPRVELAIKLHPSQRAPARGALPLLAAIAGEGTEVPLVRGPLQEAIADADVVVASYSSAVFEAILYHRPVVLFTTSQSRDLHGLAGQGAALLATRPDDIVERVLLAVATPTNVLLERRRQVWGEGDQRLPAAEIRPAAGFNLRSGR